MSNIICEFLNNLLMLLFQDKWRKISEDNYYEMDKYLNRVNTHIIPLNMFKTTFLNAKLVSYDQYHNIKALVMPLLSIESTKSIG